MTLAKAQSTKTIIGTHKEGNTTMIASRESPTAIEKRYETRSEVEAIRPIILNNNCLKSPRRVTHRITIAVVD